MRSIVAVFVATVLLVCAVVATEPVSEVQSIRDEAHMARYVMMTRIHFDTQKEALEARQTVISGEKTFLEVSEQQQLKANKRGDQDRDRQSGDLGLVMKEDMEPEVARVAFDIRNPIAKKPTDIQGPICTKNGCYLITVFLRYRKPYFSSAWYDAETFCRENGFKFNELLQSLEQGDGLKDVAFMVWPDEHISQKKIKIQMLRNDVRRIGKTDPSTVMNHPVSQGSKDLSAHHRLMAKRDVLFKTIPNKIIEDHPEIFAMSIEQIVERGWAKEPEEEVADTLTNDHGTGKVVDEAAIKKMEEHSDHTTCVDGMMGSEASCGGAKAPEVDPDVDVEPLVMDALHKETPAKVDTLKKKLADPEAQAAILAKEAAKSEDEL